jgi:hypothetical protein
MRMILIPCAAALLALALNLSVLGAAAPVSASTTTVPHDMPDCCYPGSPCCEGSDCCLLTKAKSALMPCCGQKAADCCKNAVQTSQSVELKWCCLLGLECCFPGSPCCEVEADCCFPGSPCCFPGSPCCGK